ncbi:MAG TPA: type II secretion system minor pseudopilin GspK [Gammaproteobacteria bacterium]|nr:type II secretion system minor pseudopilin GspK [Gammaproteobacteria bacterium]
MADAPRHRQRGAALIIAMLVTAIAAILAAGMLSREELDIQRTSNLLDADQAYLYGHGADNWVAQILYRDGRNNKVDDLGEAWAQPLPNLPIQGGSIGGHVEDEQGRFNLNDLVDPGGKPDQQYVEIFRRLLADLGLDPDICNAVIDWIDPNRQVRFPGGAEDSYYLAQDPPYRPADRPMLTITDLRQVKGVTPQVYQALAPYVSALPAHTPINVNTAPPEVLRALADGLSESDAKALVQARGANGWQSVSDFRSQKQLAGKKIDDSVLSVQTSYFLLQVRVTIGSVTVYLYSLLHRMDDGQVRLLSRRRGTR